jgi:hypothetical protein
MRTDASDVARPVHARTFCGCIIAAASPTAGRTRTTTLVTLCNDCHDKEHRG